MCVHAKLHKRIRAPAVRPRLARQANRFVDVKPDLQHTMKPVEVFFDVAGAPVLGVAVDHRRRQW